MGNIRINELARELGVRSDKLIGYLAELGYTDKSHSSALTTALADKVRKHYMSKGSKAENNHTPAKEVEHLVSKGLQPAPRTMAEFKSRACKLVSPKSKE